MSVIPEKPPIALLFKNMQALLYGGGDFCVEKIAVHLT